MSASSPSDSTAGAAAAEGGHSLFQVCDHWLLVSAALLSTSCSIAGVEASTQPRGSATHDPMVPAEGARSGSGRQAVVDIRTVPPLAVSTAQKMHDIWDVDHARGALRRV